MLKGYKGVYRGDWKEIDDVEMKHSLDLSFEFFFIKLRLKMFYNYGTRKMAKFSSTKL